MSKKVIMLLIDGLNYPTAREELGYVESLVEAGQAKIWKMQCALPSLSRPLYETIHTGLPPVQHGILNNDIQCRSRYPNIFSIAAENDRKTAAVAYSWMAELYNTSPYDPLEHQQIDAENFSGDIHVGRFYHRDEYPDEELIIEAQRMVRRHKPDFLLLHPMGCDYKGHAYGGLSLPYRRNAASLDNLLSKVLPEWIELGYSIVITADHGMCEDGHHGGTIDAVRAIPFYLLGTAETGVVEEGVSQLAVSTTVLKLMDLPIPQTMLAAPLI